MERVTVLLPDALAARARRTAENFGVTVGRVVRESTDAGIKAAILRLRRNDDRQRQLDNALALLLADEPEDVRYLRRNREGQVEVYRGGGRWEPEANA